MGRFGAGIYQVCFSSDGTLLALDVEGGVMVCDIAARFERRFLEGEGYGPIAFSPDGQTIAFLRDSKVILCEVATGREKLAVAEWNPSAGWKESVTALAFSPDGQAIALGYRYGRLERRDTVTGEIKGSYFGIAKYVDSVAFSPRRPPARRLGLGIRVPATFADPVSGREGNTRKRANIRRIR